MLNIRPRKCEFLDSFDECRFQRSLVLWKQIETGEGIPRLDSAHWPEQTGLVSGSCKPDTVADPQEGRLDSLCFK